MVPETLPTHAADRAAQLLPAPTPPGGRHQTDVVIVGAGPVGLFTVFECGMLKLRCHLVDALDAVGGQCVALYPEKPIYDIPGFPQIEAAGLIDNLVAQAAPFRPTLHLGQRAVACQRREDGSFVLSTDGGTVIEAKAIILAAGAGAFGPNRPPLEGLAAYEGRSIHYVVRRRADFAGQRVVIAGGGDSAVDWALSLAEVAASVAVVHRRDKFRAAPESTARLAALAEAGRIELVTPYQLAGLEGEAVAGRLSGVVVEDMDGACRTLPADHLLCFFGLATDLGPLAEWGLGLERSHVKVDQASCMTDLPGVFAVGDIATYPAKLKLILTGFAEAAAAAHAAFALCRPGEALHFEYSTSKGVGAGAH